MQLNYPDFLTLVLPSHLGVKATVVQRDNYSVNPGDKLTPSVELSICGLIQAEIEGNHKLEPYKFDITNDPNFTVFEAFRWIDKLKSGSITQANLEIFLKSTGIVFMPEDPVLFIQRLDTNSDGELSFKEFVDGLIVDLPENEYGAKYAYSEKKPSHFQRLEEENLLRTAYKPIYESPLKKAIPIKSSISPYKSSFTKPNVQTSVSVNIHKFQFSTQQKEINDGLAEILDEQLKLLRKIEQAKEELVKKEDYNLMDGFRIFDFGGKGFITLSEFTDELKSIGLDFLNSEIALFFKRCDKDSDGRLRYSDYCSMINPKKPDIEKLLSSRLPYHMHHLIEKEMYFSVETRDLHKNLIKNLIEYEKYNEEFRKNLKNKPNFNPYDAFNILDLRGNGIITLPRVKSFRIIML